MKKLFSLLTLALLTMSAWAATDVTFTAGTDVGTTSANTTPDEVTKGGITISCTDAAFATAQYRFYAGSTTTITSTVGNITKIEFTCTASGTSSNGPSFFSVPDNGTGTYSYSGNVGTWTGDASSVVLAASKQVRATQVVVTIDSDEPIVTVAAPTLPAAQTFEESFTVEITNNENGATLYYSTDGTTWNEYNQALVLTETTTVYAKATKDGVDSQTVSATYTKVEPVTGNVVTFDAAVDIPNVTNEAFTLTKGTVTFSVTQGTCVNGTGHYRIFKNQTATFTSTGANIVKIEFVCTASGTAQYGPGCFTVAEGNYSYEGVNGTWTGDAASVVFTASTNQVRPITITVTLDDGSVVIIAAPTLPAACTFEDSYTVNITNNEDGATLYYSTDNQNWTEGSSLTITETTTVYAKAVKGENESSVVSATYTKVEPVAPINTLAEVNVLGNGKDFTFGGDAVVTVQRGAYLWLRDATGYGLIYGNINGQSDVTFPAGTILSQGWTAKTKIFSGLMEYENAANVSASGNMNTQLAAIQEITALDTTMVNAYVQVKNVKSFVANGKNVTATMLDGTTMVMYNTFSESIPTEEGNYIVDGVVSTHNGMQLIILGIEGYVPETYDVNSIAEVYELSENSTFTMYNDCVVTYQNGTRLWIRDSENNSGLIYGTVEGTFANGDVLSDGWSAKYTVYNNVPEFTDPVDVAGSGDTADADPFERTTITTANVNEYVILKGISVLQDASNAKRYYNAADSLVLFNTFNLTLPEIEEGATYDVTGLVTIYYGNPQIYITEMTKVEDQPVVVRGDADGNGVVGMDDLAALINHLVYGTQVSAGAAICDSLDSTTISMDDLAALINYLVYGNWGE